MGNIGKHGRTVSIMILTIAVLACTWLLSSGAGFAASASSSVNIKVTVLDAVGVETGKSALSSLTDNQNSQMISKFVTRTASSRLCSEPMINKVTGTGAFKEAGRLSEYGISMLSFDDVVPGDGMHNGQSVSEVILTVSML